MWRRSSYSSARSVRRAARYSALSFGMRTMLSRASSAAGIKVSVLASIGLLRSPRQSTKDLAHRRVNRAADGGTDRAGDCSHARVGKLSAAASWVGRNPGGLNDQDARHLPLVRRPSRTGGRLLLLSARRRDQGGGQPLWRGRPRSGGDGDDGRFRGVRPELRRSERRTAVPLHRGDLVPDPVRRPGGSRPLLGRADRWRRARSLRVAEGPVRCLLAGHARQDAGADRRTGRRGGRARDEGDDGHGQARHRRPGGGAGGLTAPRRTAQLVVVPVAAVVVAPIVVAAVAVPAAIMVAIVIEAAALMLLVPEAVIGIRSIDPVAVVPEPGVVPVGRLIDDRAVDRAGVEGRRALAQGVAWRA